MPAIPGVTSPMTYIGMWKVRCLSPCHGFQEAVTRCGNEYVQTVEALCFVALQALQMGGSEAA